MSELRAYVDHPVGDIATATVAARTAAIAWELSQPTLIRNGMNAIFAAGDAVLRVSSPNAPASGSIELAGRLADEGLRVTQPLILDPIEANGLSVTCWERIEPTGQPIDWVTVGKMVRVVHALDRSVIPYGYPVSTPTAFPWWDFDTLLDEVRDDIDDRARAGLVSAIERWPDWASLDDSVICHGDVHPGNVMMSEDGPVLIDWDLLCSAPRGWDHAPMMTWTSRWGGETGVYEQLAEGYGDSLRGNHQAEAFAELRLVAATLMRVRAGRRNPSAMPEAQRRLGYWRGDHDAHVWRAQ